MNAPSLPRTTIARLTAMACALALLAGCGGAQNAALPPHAGSVPIGARSAARLTITIPHATNASSTQRRPQYISPATQALAVTIAGPTALSEGINLTTGNPSCTVNLYSNLVCTVNLALAPCPGNTACYTGTFTTYDHAYTNASGGSCTPLSSCTQPAGTKALSQAQSVSFLVAAGAANNLPITLGGVPAAVAVLSSAATISGNALTGFVLPTGQSGQVSVLGVDADGNYILDPGAPAVGLTTSDATQFTVSTPTASAPNLFTIANASSNPAGALLTATVTPTTASGASPLTAAADIFSGSATLYVANSNNTVTAYSSQGAQQTLTGTFPNLNGPYSIAYDPANGWLYVANNGTNTMTAYNAQGAQQSLTGTFPNLNSPYSIAYDPANGWLYVANYGNSTVTAYDAQGVQQALPSGSFPGLHGPVGIAEDPANGWLYVASYGNSTVTAYDAQGAQQSTPGTFPSLSGPYSIAYDPANGWLYVANNGNSTVTAYDAQGAQQTLTGSFPSLNYPQGIAYDPANGWLYVVNYGNNTVTAYDAQGAQQTPTGTFPNLNGPSGGPFGIAVVP
ncbi:MAG: beta-propeller fold lactonase family protein [Vulcanimicrobiaceae bacterium]